jgi:hypothetical protein
MSKSVASRYASRFRSSATWTPADWQQPQDQLIDRLYRAAWLHPTRPPNASDQEPITFTAEQHHFLLSGQLAAEQARAINDMPKFRRILQQYEEKAMEFLKVNRSERLEKLAPF